MTKDVVDLNAEREKKEGFYDWERKVKEVKDQIERIMQNSQAYYEGVQICRDGLIDEVIKQEPNELAQRRLAEIIDRELKCFKLVYWKGAKPGEQYQQRVEHFTLRDWIGVDLQQSGIFRDISKNPLTVQDKKTVAKILETYFEVAKKLLVAPKDSSVSFITFVPKRKYRQKYHKAKTKVRDIVMPAIPNGDVPREEWKKYVAFMENYRKEAIKKSGFNIPESVFRDEA